jgi:putative addiction module killer protein
MLEIRYYVTPGGSQPLPLGLRTWRRLRELRSRARLLGWNRATSRMSSQSVRVCSNIGSTLAPGYRVYFGRDGEALVILLTGGMKKRQQRDIDVAHAYWRAYKGSKRGRP